MQFLISTTNVSTSREQSKRGLTGSNLATTSRLGGGCGGRCLFGRFWMTQFEWQFQNNVTVQEKRKRTQLQLRIKYLIVGSFSPRPLYREHLTLSSSSNTAFRVRQPISSFSRVNGSQMLQSTLLGFNMLIAVLHFENVEPRRLF